MKKRLAPYPLRVANLRRFLDRHTSINQPELVQNKTVKLLDFIREQKIQILVRRSHIYEGMEFSEIVVNELPHIPKMKYTKNFYVLETNLTVHGVLDFIIKNKLFENVA